MLRIFSIIFFQFKKIYFKLLVKDIDHIIYRNNIENLIAQGLKLGKNVVIEYNAFIDRGYPYLVSIGDNCSISSNVKIFAHDDTIYRFTGGYARIGKVVIKDNCFIGDRVIILPGVTIGPNVMIAAGSVVNKNIPPNSCIAGVPARTYAKFDQFIEKNNAEIRKGVVFNYNDLRYVDHVDEELKEKIIVEAEKGICYVKGKGDNFKKMTWNSED